MSDYISRVEARNCITGNEFRCRMIQSLDSIPSADVRENVHGEWILKERTTECSIDIDIVCSKCGYVGIEGYAHGYGLDEINMQEARDYIKEFDLNYCPCCGAKMDKGDI